MVEHVDVEVHTGDRATAERRIDDAERERTAVRSAAVGAAVGAVVGSGQGPLGAGIGASVGSTAGYAVGRVIAASEDRRGRSNAHGSRRDRCGHRGDTHGWRERGRDDRAEHGGDRGPVRIDVTDATPDEDDGDTSE
jgi:hypothetical protein